MQLNKFDMIKNYLDNPKRINVKTFYGDLVNIKLAIIIKYARVMLNINFTLLHYTNFAQA